MSLNLYVGFIDGSCHITRNLSSIAWAIYDPNGDLVNLQSICLGHTTNNIFENSVFIELLSEAIALGIRDLVVNLDSQLIVL